MNYCAFRNNDSLRSVNLFLRDSECLNLVFIKVFKCVFYSHLEVFTLPFNQSQVFKGKDFRVHFIMILFTLLVLTTGIVGLYFGSKFLVVSLENFALRYGISQILIGLTILSIGTSLPEISVSIIGGIDKLAGITEGIDGLVIGNKVGSFLTQISLILGILALSQHIFVSKWELKREGLMMFLSVVIFFVCSVDGILSRLDAIIMMGIYALYIGYTIYSDRKRRAIEKEIMQFIEQRNNIVLPDKNKTKKAPSNKSWRLDLLMLVGGLILLLFGAELTLFAGHELAKDLNIPDIIIGIFIIGLGTSLPELIVDLTALKRKDNGIAIGDLMGSNICDILLATGSGAVISEFTIPLTVLIFDIPVLLTLIIIVFAAMWKHQTLYRWHCVLLLSLFGTYAVIKLCLF